jgi:hypothetical protein
MTYAAGVLRRCETFVILNDTFRLQCGNPFNQPPKSVDRRLA